VGLFIAAGITTAIALCGWAMLVRRAKDWRAAVLASVIALPLQPLAFYAVRLPLDGWLRTTFGIVGWVTIASLFYAPLIEEPAKWLTAVVPAVRRGIANDPIVMALAVGAGFGIGEIWFLAHALISSPSYPDLPFWQFSGFMIERLAVCFLHGAFAAPAFYALARGGLFWLGGLVGMVLHFFLNFPIYLAQTNAFGIGANGWGVALVSWIFLCVVGCVFVVKFLAGRFKAVTTAANAQIAPTPP
jgi:RsiW-degrading membrane proteinase PrsW (M82 family)